VGKLAVVWRKRWPTLACVLRSVAKALFVDTVHGFYAKRAAVAGGVLASAANSGAVTVATAAITSAASGQGRPSRRANYPHAPRGLLERTSHAHVGERTACPGRPQIRSERVFREAGSHLPNWTGSGLPNRASIT
jgi:hypothetical protein